MSDTLAATCRSGCALCEQITLRLGGAAGATGFTLLLETPGGLRSRYFITGWPDKNAVWPADVKAVKAERPPPTQRATPPCAPTSNIETTPGMSALHPAIAVRAHF